MFPHPVAHNQTIAPRVSAVPYRPRRAANDKVEKSGGTGPLAQWRKARFTLICQRVTVRQGGAPLAQWRTVSATLSAGSHRADVHGPPARITRPRGRTPSPPTVNWRNSTMNSSGDDPTRRRRMEVHKCRKSVAYFLTAYVRISDVLAGAWIPLRLWPAQRQALQTITDHCLTVILKARQLGLTALVLGYALWRMLFHPAATVLLFSRRDEEAVDLLTVRLRGMYERLPGWLQVRSFPTDNDHEWRWSNGSRVLAFPTTGGDSYSASLVIVDEADLVPDFGALMASVKPTIDGGGRMILVSRADKGRPNSPFKRIYQGARTGRTEWKAVFLPWSARPDRDAACNEALRRHPAPDGVVGRVARAVPGDGRRSASAADPGQAHCAALAAGVF